MIPKEGLFSKLERLEPYLLPAIVVLVGVGAFGLGRLSAAPGHQALRLLYPGAQVASPVGAAAPTVIQATAQGAGEAPSSGQASGGAYVASKSGTKYYLASCSGAARIKDENKVYFGSAQEAAAAGYGPAANCPGL